MLRTGFFFTALFVLGFGLGQSSADTYTWQVPSGTADWFVFEHWNPVAICRGDGSNATFNGQATSLNPAQTGNRRANINGEVVIGSITFNNDRGTFTNTIESAAAGWFEFRNSSGSASIDVPIAGGTGNNTISAGMEIPFGLVANVHNTTATSAAGALNLTGWLGSYGGFTKNGAGTATFGTGDKVYLGPTVLNGGVLRMSYLARAQNTSSFTINNGARLELIADGNYTLGPGPLVLNGTGVNNDGAIRPNRATSLARKVTINNPITLQSTSLIHSQAHTGSTSFDDAYIVLTGLISGPGGLQFTAPIHDDDLGTYYVMQDNTYEGGTDLFGGRLIVGNLASTFPNASLGSGDVTVYNATAPFGALVNSQARAQLTIPAGALDAIANDATLSIAGGFTSSMQSASFVELGAGVIETVGWLTLGGIPQPTGTYGSLSSSAQFRSDEFFAGPGIVRVAIGVPEPSSILLLTATALALATTRPHQPRGASPRFIAAQ